MSEMENGSGGGEWESGGRDWRGPNEINTTQTAASGRVNNEEFYWD